MSFLNNLFQDPKYQTTDPRKPEEVDDQEIIISPDTRREKRIPPGQSRTKKWPVLDAHGTPDIDLATWTFEVEGLVENQLTWSLDEFMQLPAVRVEHGPFLRARLTRRHAVLAPRVGTDDDLLIVQLVRLTRIRSLVFWILKKIIEKTHN